MPADPVVPTARRDRRRRIVRLAGRYLLLSVLALIVLFPIYITVVNSLLRPDQIASRPPGLFPTDPQWGAYKEAWEGGHIGRYMLNSAIVTTGIMVGQVLLAILAAYAFAFLEFPGRGFLFVVFLTTMMIPFEVVFFTNYQTIADLGLLNTYGGLILPFLATGFGAFLLRQAFLTVPGELRDAAALDGYGHWRFLWRVAVPLARPTVAALSVFAFLSAWGQYLWPLIVTDDDRARTVQVGLAQLRREALNDINVTFAGVVLASIPLVILLLAFQRQLVRGLTAGAVKG
ncbi:MAG: carbohydrate ABC transporter permease [Actinobacteria bacterium]|nr:carbohydrate ABC transporter permease [Actinomycetota bacterium]